MEVKVIDPCEKLIAVSGFHCHKFYRLAFLERGNMNGLALVLVSLLCPRPAKVPGTWI